MVHGNLTEAEVTSGAVVEGASCQYCQKQYLEDFKAYYKFLIVCMHMPKNIGLVKKSNDANLFWLYVINI